MDKLLHPPKELDRHDTSLRYTDILFGFAIKELFIRLQGWREWPAPVIGHLVVGTTLVLGSWIGYRRSAHRAQYVVKFFNLPFFKFICDQAMLVCYFRIATLTPDAIKGQAIDANWLASQTGWMIAIVFFLYVIWDVLGLCMAHAKTGAGYRYPNVREKAVQEYVQAELNYVGFAISFVCLVFVVGLMALTSKLHLDSMTVFFWLTAMLFMYRWCKEARTTWSSSSTSIVTTPD